MKELTLADFPLALRVVFSSFLLTIGVGLLMAGAQIMVTHGMADGKPGLSIDDIVYSYYGNTNNSKIEGKLNGSMKVMAPDTVRLNIIKWTRAGAPETEWEPTFKPIFAHYCVTCHHAGQTALPSYETYQGVKQVAEIDHGTSFTALTRVSHIHLFGIAFIFMFVTAIFAFARFNQTWKIILIVTPFAFLIVDVLSWWLTKINPNFAWLTIIGGVGYSLASTVMIFTSLAQMWLRRFKAA